MHIKLTNGVPEKYSIGQLRRDNPQVSFPKSIPDATLAEYDVYPLRATEQPQYDPMTQRVEEGTPVRQRTKNADGTFKADDPATGEDEAWEWVQTWDVIALTPEEVAQQQLALQESIVSDTQQRLDDFARSRSYDGILSACTYATSTVPKFSTEGKYCVEARDATWAALYQILAEVQAGTRPAPAGFADIEGDLPALAWPV